MKHKLKKSLEKKWWEKSFARSNSRNLFSDQSKIEDCEGYKKNFLSYIYSTSNVGDEIQTIAQMQHIPKGAKIIGVNRDRADQYRGPPAPLIANGWHLQDLSAWPMAEAINPILISMFIRETMNLNGRVGEFLHRHGPVGCRDTATVRLLESAGIPSYFSGCLTLTLRNPYPESERGDYVVVCDAHLESAEEYPPSAPNLLKRFVPESILKNAIFVEHEVPGRGDSYSWKFRRAKELLILYAKAKLVITTRLHCALPCRAMGIPVLFLHKNYKSDPRFDGLRDVLLGHDEDSSEIHVDWDNPKPLDISFIRDPLEDRLRKEIYRVTDQ